MVKFIVILMFFGFSCISFTSVKNERTKKHFSGFHVGLSFAYDYLNSGFVDSNTNNLVAKGFSVYQSGNEERFNNSLAFIGKIGYDYVFDNDILIGAELSLSYRFPSVYKESIAITNGTNAYSWNNKFSMPFTFGIILKLGYVIKEINLIYGLFGYDAALMVFSSNFFSDPTTSSNTFNTGILNGFRFGVGYERILFSTQYLDISSYFEAYYSERYYIKTSDLYNMNGINLNIGFRLRI